MPPRVPQKIQEVPVFTYQGQANNPQPFVLATGFVTSAGATGSFIIPTGFTVAKSSTGVYTITHKLGFVNKYVVVPTIVGTTAGIIQTDSYGVDTVVVRTFTDAGVAADYAFSFVFYSF